MRELRFPHCAGDVAARAVSAGLPTLMSRHHVMAPLPFYKLNKLNSEVIEKRFNAASWCPMFYYLCA
jgi:hypothetical protein